MHLVIKLVGFRARHLSEVEQSEVVVVLEQLAAWDREQSFQCQLMLLHSPNHIHDVHRFIQLALPIHHHSLFRPRPFETGTEEQAKSYFYFVSAA